MAKIRQAQSVIPAAPHTVLLERLEKGGATRSGIAIQAALITSVRI